MKKILIFAGIFLAVGAALKADLYIKYKERSGASPMDVPILPNGDWDYVGARNSFRGSWHLVSQPARNVTTENWIGDNVYASVTGHKRTVLDFGKNKIYIINNADKTYFETDLPLDTRKLWPLKVLPIAFVIKPADILIAPNGKTKKIGRWRCTGYIGTVATGSTSVKVEIWTTEDVDSPILEYLEGDYPGDIKRRHTFNGTAAVQSVAKIDVLPIATKISVNFGRLPGEEPGMYITMSVVDIVLKTPPAGLYAVPAGYRKTDILPPPTFGPYSPPIQLLHLPLEPAVYRIPNMLSSLVPISLVIYPYLIGPVRMSFLK